jgi:hypothetical protein
MLLADAGLTSLERLFQSIPRWLGPLSIEHVGTTDDQRMHPSPLIQNTISYY